MEENTLISLAAAFDAAPSAALAKVLTFAYLERNNLSAVTSYVASVADLSEAEIRTLGKYLLDNNAQDSLQALSGNLGSDGLSVLIDILQQRAETTLARTIYLAARTRDPKLRSADIEQRLNIVDEKPRLTVVEKVDFSKVTDLARYRQEVTTFDDVVGLAEVKKQINKKIILPFQKPSLFQRFKKKIGGGVLLYGPPGCGKTLLARAAAGECNATFYNIEASDVLDMYIGESEQKLRAIFEKARSQTPAVLFFDELEALAGKREHARNTTTSNLVSQFLTELDGFAQNNHGVLVLASTNVPWSVDAAFLRPGRFDRMFFVPPPDQEARQSILEHHMKGRPAASDIDFPALALKTPGHSGADLANLVEMAADEAIDESIQSGTEVLIEYRHFKEALKDSRPTTTEWLTTARNYARYANDGGRYDDVLDFMKKHGKK